MKSKILNGRSLANKIEKEIIKKPKEKRKPTLATIIVGDDKASKTYVKMKQKACKRVGFSSKSIQLRKETTTKELLNEIMKLNNDEKVDGILLQHPTPKNINERKCFDKINSKKDVDGVTSLNFGKISFKEKGYLSATPKGILLLLEEYNINLESKNALVIGRSDILGKPLASALLNKNATVTIAHSKTKGLKKIARKSDIIFACVGKEKLVKSSWIKKGTIIVDAGYNKGNVGDVELNKKTIKKASFYTPVPGGVGPMTIASLLLQTYQAYEKNVKSK